MKGVRQQVKIRHSLGGKRELLAKREGTVYGPVAVVPLLPGSVAIVHVASGCVLLIAPDVARAARTIETLLGRCDDWAHGYDGRHVVFSPSLQAAVALVRG